MSKIKYERGNKNVNRNNFLKWDLNPWQSNLLKLL